MSPQETQQIILSAINSPDFSIEHHYYRDGEEIYTISSNKSYRTPNISIHCDSFLLWNTYHVTIGGVQIKTLSARQLYRAAQKALHAEKYQRLENHLIDIKNQTSNIHH